MAFPGAGLVGFGDTVWQRWARRGRAAAEGRSGRGRGGRVVRRGPALCVCRVGTVSVLWQCRVGAVSVLWQCSVGAVSVLWCRCCGGGAARAHGTAVAAGAGLCRGCSPASLGSRDSDGRVRGHREGLCLALGRISGEAEEELLFGVQVLQSLGVLCLSPCPDTPPSWAVEGNFSNADLAEPQWKPPAGEQRQS